MDPTHSNRNLIRGGLDLIISEYSEHPEQPPKTSKTGHLRVLRRKSSSTKIAVHANSALPSCFGTCHVTVLSKPPWTVDYAGVLQHRCSSALDLGSACSE